MSAVSCGFCSGFKGQAQLDRQPLHRANLFQPASPPECRRSCQTLGLAMKHCIAIFFLLVPPPSALAGSCPAAPVEIEKAIRQHIVTLRAVEYCAARTVKNEGGITVAIYTAEGACASLSSQAKPGTCSNNWVRYMIALSSQPVTAPVEVGGKGGLNDTGVKISEGIIEVNGLSPGPNDPLCCPSVPETKRFKLSPSGLGQVRP